MFPPKPSDNPDAWLTSLWQSLMRAGDHFAEGGELHRDDEGRASLRIRMSTPLPKEAKKPVVAYMKQYAQACGWGMRVKFEKNYIALIATSKPVSRASKNR